MPIILSLQDIDEAIQNLNYKSATTLKSKLVQALRRYYLDSASETLDAIDTEALVKTVWETGDDPDLIKQKRKNFSSLKSSVNADLKKLYAEGKNPQGIVIGHSNVFTLSDEAKDKALAGIMDVFKEKGIDTATRLGDILSSLNDVLSSAAPGEVVENTKEEIERLKTLLGDLSGKMGFSLADLVEHARAEGRYGVSPGEGPAGQPDQLAGAARPADALRRGVSFLDKGLQGLTQEVAHAEEGLAHREFKDAVRRALSEMTAALADEQSDAAGKTEKILAAVQNIVNGAMDAAGESLPAGQAGEIQSLFQELTRLACAPPSTGGATAVPQGKAFADSVASILGDGALGTGDKIGRILDAVGEMIGQALDDPESGLSPEDAARIREMMSHVSENLAAFAEGALSEAEIIEEIIEDDAGESLAAEEAATEEAPLAASETIAETLDDQAIVEDALVEDESLVADEAEPLAVEAVAEAPSEEETLIDQDILEEVVPGAAEIFSEPGEELADAEQIVELLEEGSEGSPDLVEEILDIETQESALDDQAQAEDIETLDAQTDIEDIPPDAPADAIVELADGPESEPLSDETAFAEAAPEGDFDVVEEPVEEPVGPDLVEDTSAGATLEGDFDVVGETADSDLVEDVVEEAVPDIVVKTDGAAADDDLREKTDLLSRLAEAAGALEKIGPDLSGSVYTEDEIRLKAKLLSEEFDKYLSIRDKYFNQHILIKGGSFLVGGDARARSVLPEQLAELPDFYVGKFPVTNALFEIFVEQTGYITTAEKYGFSLVYYPRMQRSRDPLTGTERFSLHLQAYSKRVPGACWHRPFGPDSALHLKRTHPVVHVSLEDARAFAAWTGKRLPTEVEWEAAARTARGLLYPWGNDWVSEACNIETSLHGDTTPVDHYAKFANEAEVADTLGNVLEWTLDIIGDPESSDTCIAKGASWISHGEISLLDRHYIEKTASSNILGFRCVAI
ncbi:MAG TPA: SUMF1/EgtB/PvdO family nonheme iron enzyme [Smithellaceae bacterium]|nr:SUMF1/EgtB/PvdO family nonheme iron enzyme [Smithellaceae bacterium]